jgi:predicted Zn-dependent protease with MMP-like domain
LRRDHGSGLLSTRSRAASRRSRSTALAGVIPVSAAMMTDQELADVVRHVLVHEIGHHFGFSDNDMKRIETAG